MIDHPLGPLEEANRKEDEQKQKILDQEQRSREIADTVRRFLIASNTGGIGAILVLAGKLSEARIDPRWSIVPIVLFLAALATTGFSLLRAKAKALARREALANNRPWPSIEKLLQQNKTFEHIALILFILGSLSGLIAFVMIPLPSSFTAVAEVPMDALVQVFESAIWPLTLLVIFFASYNHIWLILEREIWIERKDGKWIAKILAGHVRGLPQEEARVFADRPVYDPIAEVLAAWQDVDDEARELLISHGVKAPKTYKGWGSLLKSKSLLDEEYFARLDDLRQIRDTAVGRRAGRITEENARQYSDCAAALIEYMESLKPQASGTSSKSN